MKCFFHSADFDGQCSGAIVKYAYPECELIGINYGEPFPFESITDPEEHVFMVDFSLPLDDMKKLKDMCNFIWIDHHYTAIALAGVLEIEGIQSTDDAACVLTHRFIYPDEPIPRFIDLVAKWDTWKLDDDVIDFHYGLSIEQTDPRKEDSIWDVLFSFYDYVNEKTYELSDTIIKTGKSIKKYVDSSNKDYCEKYAFETQFYHRSLEHYKCIAVNLGNISSFTFQSIPNVQDYDIMLGFVIKNNKCTVSLRTAKENVDVGAIAKQCGGGGHKKAAGFICESQYLPFRVHIG